MARPIDAARMNKDEGFFKAITIPSASVLTLNTVGYTLLTAPTNALYAICVTEFFIRISAGTAYSSVHDMTVAYGAPLSQGATICTIPGTGFLDQSTATGVWASFNGTSSKGTIVVPGAAVSILAGTGDPATGTSALQIRLKYKIHKVA